MGQLPGRYFIGHRRNREEDLDHLWNDLHRVEGNPTRWGAIKAGLSKASDIIDPRFPTERVLDAAYRTGKEIHRELREHERIGSNPGC